MRRGKAGAETALIAVATKRKRLSMGSPRHPAGGAMTGGRSHWQTGS
jgi:hypothetical protein